MTPEHKKQLDRMILMQRLKIIVPSIAAVAIVFAAITWISAIGTGKVDPAVEQHTVAGHVVGMARLTGRRGRFQVHVKLDGGREVDAVSALPQPPYPGEEVELSAATHESGKVTYNVVRFIN